MIENLKEYKVSRQQLKKFKSWANHPAMEQSPPNVDPRLWEASREGLKSLTSELEEEIFSYEYPWKQLDETSLLVRELLTFITPKGDIVDPCAGNPDHPGGIAAGLELMRPTYGYPVPYTIFTSDRRDIVGNDWNGNPARATTWDDLEYVMPNKKIDWVITHAALVEPDDLAVLTLALRYAKSGVAFLSDGSCKQALSDLTPVELKMSHCLSIENSNLMWFVWQKGHEGEVVEATITNWQLIS